MNCGKCSLCKVLKWKNELTTNIFFFLIYRIPCRSGICRTPIQVTCSQLIASEILPTIVVKALLYPGAIANALFKNKTIPSYNNLLELYNLTNMKSALATSDLHRIEVSIFKLFFHDYLSWKGKYEDQSKLRGEEYIEGLCLLQANCFIQKLCKVKCNTWCELWNFTDHWVFEHKLHLKPFGKGLVYLGVAHLCSPNSASLKGCGPSMGAEVNWQQVFPYIKKRILKKNKKKLKVG